MKSEINIDCRMKYEGENSVDDETLKCTDIFRQHI